MREFIRHPISVPLLYRLGDVVVLSRDPLKNISQGGLCFASQKRIDPGTKIHVNIAICTPSFESDGVVVWCRQVASQYDIGISFLDNKSAFSMRMVEQICQIVLYRNDVLEKEGRELTETEAALEWIEKHAPDFPA